MIEVLPVRDAARLEALYQTAGLIPGEAGNAVEAAADGTSLGFCLFDLAGDTVTVRYLAPAEDPLLADGILRSALHVGVLAGMTEARYTETAPETLLRRLGFLTETPGELKIGKLFESCCGK